MKVLIGKQAMIAEKERLYWKQECKCPLCGLDLNPNIQLNHIDHDHSLEGSNAGRVRALLCIYCNPLEGELLHKFDSSGLKGKGVEYVEWLRRLLNYYEQNLEHNNIHPNFIVDKVNRFKYLNKPEMISELEQIGTIIPDKATKADLIELYRVNFRKYIKVKYNGKV